MRSYKVTLLEDLSENDPDRRMDFCILFSCKLSQNICLTQGYAINKSLTFIISAAHSDHILIFDLLYFTRLTGLKSPTGNAVSSRENKSILLNPEIGCCCLQKLIHASLNNFEKKQKEDVTLAGLLEILLSTFSNLSVQVCFSLKTI